MSRACAPLIRLESADSVARERARRDSPSAHLYDLLDQVRDPELPVLSIWDLGILREVRESCGEVCVVVTPTYSGCPALGQIEADIRASLAAAGETNVRVQTRLAPAWTTDWLGFDARRRLSAYGVAAPDALVCPQCGSSDVQLLSEFSATACKALYRCGACLEPFDYFKPH